MQSYKEILLPSNRVGTTQTERFDNFGKYNYGSQLAKSIRPMISWRNELRPQYMVVRTKPQSIRPAILCDIIIVFIIR